MYFNLLLLIKAKALTNTHLRGGEGRFLCRFRGAQFLRGESGWKDQETWVSISALFLSVLPNSAAWPLVGHFTFGNMAM